MEQRERINIALAELRLAVDDYDDRYDESGDARRRAKMHAAMRDLLDAIGPDDWPEPLPTMTASDAYRALASGMPVQWMGPGGEWFAATRDLPWTQELWELRAFTVVARVVDPPKPKTRKVRADELTIESEWDDKWPLTIDGQRFSHAILRANENGTTLAMQLVNSEGRDRWCAPDELVEVLDTEGTEK